MCGGSPHRGSAVTEDEAKSFSAKSLRCGGVSSAAAACVRGGVIHGHGGWFDIQSQKHYDLMKKGEEGLVSTRLGDELAKCMGRPVAGNVRAQGQAGLQEHGQQQGQHQPQRSMLVPLLPRAQRTVATMPVGEEYVIKEVQKHRGDPDAGDREFLVLWEACEANGYAVDEMTWQSEAQLRDDGVGGMLEEYLATVPPPRRSARLRDGGGDNGGAG